MLGRSPIGTLIVIFAAALVITACGTVDEFRKSAVEEYKFYRKAKKEAQAKELANMVRDELDESPPRSIARPPEGPPEDVEYEEIPPPKECKFSFLKLRRICE